MTISVDRSDGAARLLSWADRHALADTRYVQPRRGTWLDRLHEHSSRAHRQRSAMEIPHGEAQEGWVPHDQDMLEHTLRYACNICGSANQAPMKSLDRESPTCRRCGSSVRLRSMIDLLSRSLFGASHPISRFPRACGKAGIGLSDALVYAGRLARKLVYVNTFYHQAPQMDIGAPDPELHGSCDFVIASDVLEHVAPPVNEAFEGVHSLLRPGGVFVGSVPYSLKDEPTIEHFPQLHQFRIIGHEGIQLLHNRRRDGSEEVFDQLVFHGGEGATLEMRLFSRASLMEELRTAGFSRIRYCEKDVPEWGIVWLKPWSIPFVAFK